LLWQQTLIVGRKGGGKWGGETYFGCISPVASAIKRDQHAHRADDYAVPYREAPTQPE